VRHELQGEIAGESGVYWGVRNLSTWAFLLGAAAAAGALWVHCGNTGRSEEYAVSGGHVYEIGKGESAQQAPRLALATIKGADRQPLEVSREMYDAVRDGDQLHIRTRTVPVLGGELIQYAIVRGGATQIEWQEGAPFFGFSLGLIALLGGGAGFLLYRFIAALFKFKPPSDV